MAHPMVLFNYSTKELTAKVVYYGPGLCGKTTNLQWIHEKVPIKNKGKMLSLSTETDRTLFFDFLPIELGTIRGMRTRIQLYTVPGQVFYNATRKLVLKGADALVFVADSEVGKMEENKESLANLRANLAEYGLTLDSIPWVIQYNKRDLPNVYTVDELNAELNPGGVPSFEAVASEGKGVFETFRGVSHLLMEKVTRDLRRSPGTPARSAPQPAAHVPAHRDEPEAPPPPRAPATLPRSAAPSAPGQAIRREAQASPAPVTDATRIDYGVELELGGPRDGGSPQARADAVTTAGVATDAIRGVPLPRPSGTMPRPKVEEHEAPSTDSETSPKLRSIVVPVKLPPGGQYEIVIRLEIDTNP
jgi:hypothetical protein